MAKLVMMESHNDAVLIFITGKEEEVTKKLRSVSLLHRTACALSFSQNLRFFLLLFNFFSLAMEMSGSSSKKRKLICSEDDDEAQMETFFALVRNIREARDRWMGLKSGDRRSKRGEIMSKEENSRVGVWKPTFQVEDFAYEEAEQRKSGSEPSASQRENCEKKEGAEKGIDLSLSL